MATRSQIRSDIILRLTSGKPSDDFELDDRQIDFWIDTIRAELLLLKIKDESDKDIDSFFQFIDCLPIQKEVPCEDDCNARYYVELPSKPIDLKDDSGIRLVETSGGSEIKRMRVSDIHILKNLRFSNPSPSNMAFYRIDTKLIIRGGTVNFLKNGKVNIVAALSNPSSSISDDSEYPISEDLLPILLDRIEEIGRRQEMGESDLINDGVDE